MTQNNKITQYKKNHYHKSANSHEHNTQCGKFITQYNVPKTDVFVLPGKYMPHEHKFGTETSYLKHPRRIQQLQDTHFEAEYGTSRQWISSNGTLHYPALIFSGIRKRIQMLNYSHSRNPACVPAHTHRHAQALREPFSSIEC
jgi:hypothetical protein